MTTRLSLWPAESPPISLPLLQSLSLMEVPLQDADLLVMLRECGQHLRHLALFSCHFLLVDVWLVIADMAPHLISLELCSGGMEMTERGWREAVLLHPRLAHLIHLKKTASKRDSFFPSAQWSTQQNAFPFRQLAQLTVDLSRMGEVDVDGFTVLIGLLSAAPICAMDIYLPEHPRRAPCYMHQLARLPQLRHLSARNLTQPLADLLARCSQPLDMEAEEDGRWLRYTMERRVYGDACADDMDARAQQLTSSYTSSNGRFHRVWNQGMSVNEGRDTFFHALEGMCRGRDSMI